MSCICGYLHFTRDLQYEFFYLSQYILQFILTKEQNKMLMALLAKNGFPSPSEGLFNLTRDIETAEPLIHIKPVSVPIRELFNLTKTR